MPDDMLNQVGIFTWNRQRQLVPVYKRLRELAKTSECLELIEELCDLHCRIVEECKELLAALAIDIPGEYTSVTVSDDLISIIPFLWRTENEVLEQGFLRLDSLVEDQSGRAVLLKVSTTQGRKLERLRKIAEICRIVLGIEDRDHRRDHRDRDHDRRPWDDDDHDHDHHHHHRPPVHGVTEYIVRPGDTMFLIAQKFGVSLDALIAANPQVRNPDMIFPGEVLRIPGGRRHTMGAEMRSEVGTATSPSGARRYIVTSGDTIEIIAGRFGLNTSEFTAFNPQLQGRTTLSPGEVVFIPATGAVG